MCKACHIDSTRCECDCENLNKVAKLSYMVSNVGLYRGTPVGKYLPSFLEFTSYLCKDCDCFLVRVDAGSRGHFTVDGKYERNPYVVCKCTTINGIWTLLIPLADGRTISWPQNKGFIVINDRKNEFHGLYLVSFKPKITLTDDELQKYVEQLKKKVEKDKSKDLYSEKKKQNYIKQIVSSYCSKLKSKKYEEYDIKEAMETLLNELEDINFKKKMEFGLFDFKF